jgi:phosphoglucosamine mutase
MAAPSVQEAIKEAEALLAGDGRLLVRPSGTEQLIRVMAEAPTEMACERACVPVVDALRQLVA